LRVEQQIAPVAQFEFGRRNQHPNHDIQEGTMVVGRITF